MCPLSLHMGQLCSFSPCMAQTPYDHAGCSPAQAHTCLPHELMTHRAPPNAAIQTPLGTRRRDALLHGHHPQSCHGTFCTPLPLCFPCVRPCRNRSRKASISVASLCHPLGVQRSHSRANSLRASPAPSGSVDLTLIGS